MKRLELLKRALACALCMLMLAGVCALAEEAEKTVSCRHTDFYVWEEKDYDSYKYEYIDRVTHRYTYRIVKRHISCSLCGEVLQSRDVDITVTDTTYHWWGNWDTAAENILYCGDCEKTIVIDWPCSHHQLYFGEDANGHCPECDAIVVLNPLQYYCDHSDRTVYYPNKAFVGYSQWDSKQHVKTTTYYIYEDLRWGIDADCNECGLWLVCHSNGSIDYCGNTDRVSWESDDTSVFENHTFRNGVCACGEKQLSVLKLSAELETIEDRAFYGDISLERVEVSEKTVSIGSKAFANSGVKEISLPASVAYIADDAFDGCADIVIEAAPGTYAYNWAVGKKITVR